MITILIFVVSAFSNNIQKTEGSKGEDDTIKYVCTYNKDYKYNSNACNECFVDIEILDKNNKNYKTQLELLNYSLSIQNKREDLEKFKLYYNPAKEKFVLLPATLKLNLITEITEGFDEAYVYKSDTLFLNIEEETFYNYLNNELVLIEYCEYDMAEGEFFSKEESYIKDNQIILERSIESYDNTWRGQFGGTVESYFYDKYFINISSSTNVYYKKVDLLEKICTVSYYHQQFEERTIKYYEK